MSARGMKSPQLPPFLSSEPRRTCVEMSRVTPAASPAPAQGVVMEQQGWKAEGREEMGCRSAHRSCSHQSVWKDSMQEPPGAVDLSDICICSFHFVADLMFASPGYILRVKPDRRFLKHM